MGQPAIEVSESFLSGRDRSLAKDRASRFIFGFQKIQEEFAEWKLLVRESAFTEFLQPEILRKIHIIYNNCLVENSGAEAAEPGKEKTLDMANSTTLRSCCSL